MNQKNKTNLIILNPMLLSLSTVQLRTQVSMGGQRIARMDCIGDVLRQSSRHKVRVFRSIRMVSGPGQKPPLDEQRPSANVRQIVQFVRKEPDNWARKAFLNLLRSSGDRRFWLLYASQIPCISLFVPKSALPAVAYRLFTWLV
jgi:hypothetical protein